MKLAIVGTGISGLVAAHQLCAQHDLTVFEAADYAGGHTCTVDVELNGRCYAVDTGFIVYNERTYPNFCRLLSRLGVVTQPSSMSFSVRCERSGLEYNGTSLNALFAQRLNLFRPSFHRMIWDILRFNREAPRLLDGDDDQRPLGEYLAAGRYSRQLVEHYIIPMGSAIWSTPPRAMLDFPARFFVRFLHNHGMLSVSDRPVWRVVTGGSRRYVEALIRPFRERIRLRTPVTGIRRDADGVTIATRNGPPERFDRVIIAVHADQALRMLDDPSDAERDILRAFPYQANEAVLHTDERLLPRRRRAWASWNYHLLPERLSPVALTYNMNILQGLSAPRQFCVTLNRSTDIDPRAVLRKIAYHHPVFTADGVRAQDRWPEINGVRATYYCGAYWRHGFHEDGVVSALNVCRLIGRQCPDGVQTA